MVKRVKITGEVKGYLIHEAGNGDYTLCKILKEYGSDSNSKEECQKDLVALLSGSITEKEILKQKQVMRRKE